MTGYRVIRSNRKTYAVEVRGQDVIARVPYFARQKDIDRLIAGHEKWINEKLEKNRAAAADAEPLSEVELKALIKRAKKYIPDRVAYYAALMGTSYGRISIRRQRTRWGSCSRIGNLNFNVLLMLTPPEVIDSIVVHELAHRRYMNHSRDFYSEIYKVYPEYDRWNRWLKDHSTALMNRLG